MTGLLDIVVLFLLAAPIAVVAAVFVGLGPGLLAASFRPVTPPGWPRGVQEEDGVAWRWPAPTSDESARDAGPAAPTRPVRGRVTIGAARLRR